MPVCAIAGSDHRPVSQRPGSLGGSPEENHPVKMPKSPEEEGLQDMTVHPSEGRVVQSPGSSLVRALPEGKGC